MLARKIALTTILVIGLGLLAVPFVTDMLAKTQAVERLTGDLRPVFDPAALKQTRTDLNTVQAMSDQLQSQTLPALPAALKMSPAQFQAFLGDNFRDVATGVGQLNTILPRFHGLVGGLEARSADFAKADQIPTAWLPSTMVPFLFWIPGAILTLLAAAGLFFTLRGERQAVGKSALWASVGVGAALMLATVVLSVPEKGAAVDRIDATFGPVFTTAGADQVRSDMNVVQAMSDELQAKTLPALAGALQMNPEQFEGFMVQNFPDVATGVGQLNTILPRFQGLASIIESDVSDFRVAMSIPTQDTATSTLAWWFVIPGILLLLAPAGALLEMRAQRPSGPRPEVVL
ncbi:MULTISPECIES: hypothetical protein [Rhodococcus]|uniref:hypothetical protein n=1 Tax=Rhodococcus TaxID=1827 RepID=UPI002953E678|nr:MULTISPECIES: hypothetical protein [Rhodococcus]MDV7246310.1 hypothetical protein [Rhodococcus oxybenzonivorans]MDV7337408.1 hypothetical protein [Rhodococcus oxybenzonivorans]MDV7348066.1 hypothetical protein [Rhodococcus oxybenzonivorans]MDV8031716.1 hypothetical protein [Rhodococcus sp. IEGM 27]